MRSVFFCIAVFATCSTCWIDTCSADIVSSAGDQNLVVGIATSSSSGDTAFNGSLPFVSLNARADDSSTTGFSEATQTLLGFTESTALASLQMQAVSEAEIPVPPNPQTTSVVAVSNNRLEYNFTLDDTAYYSIVASTQLQTDVTLAANSGLFVRLRDLSQPPSDVFRVDENQSLTETGTLNAGSYRFEANAFFMASERPATPQEILSRYDFNFTVSNIPEPSSGTLMAFALGAFTIFTRQRRFTSK